MMSPTGFMLRLLLLTALIVGVVTGILPALIAEALRATLGA